MKPVSVEKGFLTDPVNPILDLIDWPKYITAHTSGGDLPLSPTLKHFLNVYGDQLVLSHRKYLVFRRRISLTTHLDRDLSGAAVLDDGTELPTSRRYCEALRRQAKLTSALISRRHWRIAMVTRSRKA
jgi:DNA-binding LytR/AlgR family response regulator